MAGLPNKPGYLLPAGDAYTEEMQCCFVFVPAKDEYRRAFFGALDYFGTWLAWERDDDHRGIDAARAWKEANDKTRECWEMGTCEDISTKLSAIIALLAAPRCCGEGNNYTTYYDNRVYTTTIIPDSGDYPDYYGETAVTSWEDWKQYVCYNANKYLDDLIESANRIDTLLDIGFFAIDTLAAIMAPLTFVLAPIAHPLNIPWVTAIWSALIQGGQDYMEGIADALEGAREDVVCALVNGTSLHDAIESAIGESLAWELFYSHLDYSTVTAIIYEGGNELGYLPAEQSAACDCEEGGDYSYTWEFDDSGDYYEGWQPNSGIVIDGNATYGNPAPEVRMAYNSPQALYITMYWLGAAVGFSLGASDSIILKRVEFDYISHDNSLAPGITMKLYSHGSLATTLNYAQHRGSIQHVDYTLPSPLTADSGDTVIDFKPYGGSGWYVYLDNVKLYFEVVIGE